MLYREAGQFKTSYAADQALFPLIEDRIGIMATLLVASAVIPAIGGDFLLNGVMIPFLIFALTAVGLSVLVELAAGLTIGTVWVAGLLAT